jgi:DNA-binding MarR family transcriptional regulator
VEFGFLRTALDLTAGNLSQHLTVLEKAGLVAIEKGYEGKRARTWITLTAPGDKALRAEIHHLKRLIKEIEPGRSKGPLRQPKTAQSRSAPPSPKVATRPRRA